MHWILFLIIASHAPPPPTVKAVGFENQKACITAGKDLDAAARKSPLFKGITWICENDGLRDDAPAAHANP